MLKLVSKYIDNQNHKGVILITVLRNPPSVQRRILKKFLDNTNYDSTALPKDSAKFHYSPKYLKATATNYFILLKNATELSAALKQYKALPTYNVHAQW